RSTAALAPSADSLSQSAAASFFNQEAAPSNSPRSESQEEKAFARLAATLISHLREQQTQLRTTLPLYQHHARIRRAVRRFLHIFVLIIPARCSSGSKTSMPDSVSRFSGENKT